MLLVFDRFEPVDYGCGVFPLVEVVFFRDCAVDAVEDVFADFAYLGLRGVDESAGWFVCEVRLVILKCYECVFVGCSVHSVVDSQFSRDGVKTTTQPKHTSDSQRTTSKRDTEITLHASFRHAKHRNSTELSKHIWTLKDNNIEHFISWRILSSHSPYNSSSKRCNLCLKEKFLIICRPARVEMLQKVSNSQAKPLSITKFPSQLIETPVFLPASKIPLGNR